MKPLLVLGAFTVVLVLALAALTSLQPAGPTGYAVAPPTHWIDGSQVLIEADVLDAPLGPTPVKITVNGDIVWRTVLVDGEKRELSGVSASQEWIADSGTLIQRLSPGEHVIHAYSCIDSPTGYKCGCVNEDNCGNWMRRTVVVE